MAFQRGDVRNILTEAGVSDENIEAAVTRLVKLHIGVVDPLKSENEALESRVSAAEKLKSQLENANRELAELKDADYKTKYEAEKTNSENIRKEYEKYKTETEKKAVRSQKIDAFKEIMKDVGIAENHYDLVIKYTDIDGLELDEKGKITTAKDIRKQLNDEWADTKTETKVVGANPANPPVSGNGGTSKMTKEEIFKRDDKGEFVHDSATRQRAIAENREVFGI